MRILLVLALTATLTACALIDSRPLTASTAVQLGTIRLITAAEDPQERAESIVTITEFVSEQVDAGSTATVAGVADLTRELIDYDQLGAYEQILINALITSVQERLITEIGSGRIDEQDVVRIQQILQWANQAAMMYTDA
jgi:hypothetical protein